MDVEVTEAVEELARETFEENGCLSRNHLPAGGQGGGGRVVALANLGEIAIVALINASMNGAHGGSTAA